MKSKEIMNIVLRPKRQVTLPRGICDQLGIVVGDKLELVLDGSTLIARPKKVVALEALREIRETFKRSGVTEKELLKAGLKTRQELTKNRYATKA